MPTYHIFDAKAQYFVLVFARIVLFWSAYLAINILLA